MFSASKSWKVSWQANGSQIHGICGGNSLCSYSHESETGRKCSCLPGYKMKNLTDWSYGCEPNLQVPGNGDNDSVFLHFPMFEFYGFDIGYFPNYTLENCSRKCLD